MKPQKRPSTIERAFLCGIFLLPQALFVNGYFNILEANSKKVSAFSDSMPYRGCFFPFWNVLIDNALGNGYDKVIRYKKEFGVFSALQKGI